MKQQNLFTQSGPRDTMLTCKRTFLTEISEEALNLADFAPEILTALTLDIELGARQAKKVRLMDEIWFEADLPRFPNFRDRVDPSDFDSVPAASLKLFDGRPRGVDAELLLILVAANGADSCTTAKGYDRLADSARRCWSQ